MFKWIEGYYRVKLKDEFKKRFQNVLVIDTSVIIDGRVISLFKHDGFDGDIIIPTFVIDQLNMMKDSKQLLANTKGQRGLIVLDKLKRTLFESGRKNFEIHVTKPLDSEYAFDEAIVKFCAESTRQAILITMDAQVTKVARAHHVKVLNLHELMNDLQDTIFAGEKYTLTLTGLGKEEGQCIGYLKDNTLVVVNNSTKYLKKTVPIVVRNVIKTDTGRIVFADLQ